MENKKKHRNFHMTHTHICTDGKKRTMHWSYTAKVGDVWTCHRCGISHTLVEHGGQPPIMRESRKQSKQELTTSSSSGNGCLGVFAIISLSSLCISTLIWFLIFN